MLMVFIQVVFMTQPCLHSHKHLIDFLLIVMIFGPFYYYFVCFLPQTVIGKWLQIEYFLSYFLKNK